MDSHPDFLDPGTTEAVPGFLEQEGGDAPAAPGYRDPDPQEGEAQRPVSYFDDPGAFAAILASPAMDAFLNARVDQMVKHGHTPDADLQKPLDHLLRRHIHPRIIDMLDLLGDGDAGGVPLDRLEAAARKAAITGALMMSVHDQITTTITRRRADGASS